MGNTVMMPLPGLIRSAVPLQRKTKQKMAQKCLTSGVRSISQSHENRWQVLISWMIEQRIHCAITDPYSGAMQCGLQSISLRDGQRAAV